MLFYLDYLAVCAQAYDFLQRFIAEWDTGRSILLLPNWAFSLALAAFQQAQQQPGGHRKGTAPCFYLKMAQQSAVSYDHTSPGGDCS